MRGRAPRKESCGLQNADDCGLPPSRCQRRRRRSFGWPVIRINRCTVIRMASDSDEPMAGGLEGVPAASPREGGVQRQQSRQGPSRSAAAAAAIQAAQQQQSRAVAAGGAGRAPGAAAEQHLQAKGSGGCPGAPAGGLAGVPAAGPCLRRGVWGLPRRSCGGSGRRSRGWALPAIGTGETAPATVPHAVRKQLCRATATLISFYSWLPSDSTLNQLVDQLNINWLINSISTS